MRDSPINYMDYHSFYGLFPILYVAISLFGAFANVSVIYKVARVMRKQNFQGLVRKDFYIPLITLALADLTMLAVSLLQLQTFNDHIFCKLLNAIAHCITALRTICWTSISLIRYLAIYQPLRQLYTPTFTTRRFKVLLTVLSLLLVWLFATVSVGLNGCQSETVWFGGVKLNRVVHVTELVLFYLIPMGAVLIMDFRVLFIRVPRRMSLSQSTSGFDVCNEGIRKHQSMNCAKATQVAKMWLMITTLSLLCNLPEVYAMSGALSGLWNSSTVFYMWARLLCFTQFVFTSLYLVSIVNKRKNLSLQSSVSLNNFLLKSPSRSNLQVSTSLELTSA